MIEALNPALVPLGFTRAGDGPWLAAWTRKTWNTNRGVVVLSLPRDVEPAEQVALERRAIGRRLGYVPFLSPIGLQFILLSQGSQGDLDGAVDVYNNQRIVVQSVFLVTPHGARGIRGWVHPATDPIQVAIAEALGLEGEGRDLPVTARRFPWYAPLLVAALVCLVAIGTRLLFICFETG